MKRRFLSLIIALCLCVGLLPGEALAATPATRKEFGVIAAGTTLEWRPSYTDVGYYYYVDKGDGELKKAENAPSSDVADGYLYYQREQSDSDHTMTVTGRVELPTPADSYGLDVCIPSGSYAFIIQGDGKGDSELIVPGGIYGRKRKYANIPGRDTYPIPVKIKNCTVTIPEGDFDAGALDLSAGAVLNVPNGSLGLSDSSSGGEYRLTGNARLTAKTLALSSQQSLLIEKDASAAFETGSLNKKPRGVGLHGTLSIADDGANQLSYLTPMTTEIFAEGHLLLGGQETDMDPAAKAFVPFGAVDRKKVDYTGLDLTLVSGSGRFTTDNGWLEWDAGTQTLTMNNASLNRRVGADPSAKSTLVLPTGDVTICLQGQNVLTTLGVGIDATACSSLTVTGPGELRVSLATTVNSATYALKMGTGEFILRSGTFRVPDPSRSLSYYGISSEGKVTVSGGELRITFPASYGTGVKALAMDISGGVVSLSCNQALDCSAGGPINISGGTTTVTGRMTGLHSGSDFTMSGGTLRVSATNVSSYAALYAGKSITITGGDLTAKGETGQGAMRANKSDALSYANVTLTVPEGGTVGKGNMSSGSYIVESGGATIAREAVLVSNTRYTLTVNSDGAGASGSGSYAPGSAAVIDAGNKAGYLFAGWELTGGGKIENADSAKTLVTLQSGDATVTAKWAPSYTVTVSGTGATGLRPNGGGTYKAGDTVTIYAGVRNGHDLEKWSCDDETVTFADPTAATTTFTMPAKNVTVTATWVKSSYTVTLEGGGTGASGGGTYAAGETVTIRAGTKTDGVFSGWTGAGVSFANASAAQTTFVMPAASVTVTANWDRAYQVRVISENAQNVTGAGTYVPGASVTVNAGSRRGPAADGGMVNMVVKDWTVQPEVTLNKTGDKTVQFLMPEQDVTLTANWAIPSYTVTVEGTGTGGSQTGTYETGSYVALSAGTKEHYTFTGWTITSQISTFPEDEKSENTRFLMPASDVTVKANWALTQYRLNILEGGSNPDPDPITEPKFAYGAQVDIYAGVKDGYEFSHWTSNNGGTFADANAMSTTFTMPDGDVDLTAHWEKEAVPSLLITLSAIRSPITVNGQRYEDASLHLHFEPGTTVTLEPESVIGFRGWGASSGLTLTPEQQDPANPVLTFVMPDHYVRLYANWWKMAFLEIQDVGIGGSEGDYHKKDDAVSIRAGTMPGKTFLYWEEVDRDADLMGSRRFADHTAPNTTYTMPEGYTTIRAVWRRDTEGIYTLLVKDGGIGATASRTYAPGETVTVSAGQREDEAFASWEAEGVTLDDDMAETVSFSMPEGDVTLRAHWNRSGQEVTLVSAGTGASGGGFYGPGRTVSAYAGERRGYHFVGWEVSPAAVSLSDPTDARVSFSMPEVPVTLTAKWAPNSHTLTVEGLEGGTRTETRPFEERVSLAAGERAGYAFAGWQCDVQGLLTDPESRQISFSMPDSDVTLTATWVNTPDETGALTLYLDELEGNLIIEEDKYWIAGTGIERPFSGPYILTQRDPGVPTSHSVTIRFFYTDRDFDVTLKNVDLAADSGKAAIRIENAANVDLTLRGENTLTGGAGHAGIELVATGGTPDTTLTIHGTDGDTLTVTGGEGGAGIGGSGGSSYGTVKIQGGVITARGGGDAAGIGGSASGGKGSVEISGGTVTAVGSGNVPAIGGADTAHIVLSGGSVTAESRGAALDVGPVSGGGTVRLGSADGRSGGARVTVSGPDRMSGKPAVPVSAGEEHNYDWTGVLFEGDVGMVYRGEHAPYVVSVEELTIPGGKTLHVPEGVTLQVPRGKLQESGNSFRGEGWVLLGEDGYHYISPEGALIPFEAQLNGFTVYPTLQELLKGEEGGKPLLYGEGNHVRLLADVSYPEDILFPYETVQCFEVELDLNGKTLDMGAHSFLADVAYYAPVARNYFLLSDTSADGTGGLTGNSPEPLLRTKLGLLVIRGGTYVNNGSGPALRIENAQPVTRLEGGTFSKLETTYKGSDGQSVPLTGFLGDGYAFFDETRQAWVAPGSKASTLEHVSVARLSGALADLSLIRADGQVSLLGAEGKQTSCRWFARPYGTENRAEIKNFRQDTLKLDSRVLKDGTYHLSCVVTVDGQDVVTDEILATIKAAGGSGGGSSGSGSGSGTASRPASDRPGTAGKTEEPKTAVTVDGETVKTEEKDGALVLKGGPYTAAADSGHAPTFSISVPGKTRLQIPLAQGGAGTVAVLVREGGSEEPVRLSAVAGDSLVLQVDGSATVKLMDRTSGYADVENHWAKQAGCIDFVTARELFRGMGNDLFAPDLPMTRAMVVTALQRLLSGETVSQGESGYTDVPADAWYAGAIRWATDAEIVNGVGEGRFAPEESVSRENLCLMLYRLAKSMGCAGEPGSLDDFSDGDEVHSWAVEAVS